MEISTRECAQYSSVAWTEVTAQHDSTKITFDVRGSEKRELAEHLASVGFDLMPDVQSMVNFLRDHGHLDDIVDYADTEDEEE